LWQVQITNGKVTVFSCFENSSSGYVTQKVTNSLSSGINNHPWVKQWSELSAKENLSILWPQPATNSEKLLKKKNNTGKSEVVRIEGLKGLTDDLSKLITPLTPKDSAAAIQIEFTVDKNGAVFDARVINRSAVSPNFLNSIEIGIINLPYSFEPAIVNGIARPVTIKFKYYPPQ
jgi:hypothetical protein